MQKALVLFALAFAAIVILPTSARADGVTDIRIDPATGITISTPGSYRLVGNVTMTSTTAMAVTIIVNDVTLDLGGHTITASGGATLGEGIFAVVSPVTGLTVMNGAIKGFPLNAIAAGARTTLRNVRAEGNNKNGASFVITLGDNATVEGCVIANNSPSSGSTTALSVGAGSRVVGNIVENNVSTNNFAKGIGAGADCVITDNVVRGNSGASSGPCTGIATSSRCIIQGNTVSNNDNTGTGDATGISALVGSVIERNSCANHNTGITGSATARGITGGSCTIVGNDCSFNSAGGGNGSASGITGASLSLVRDNRCDQNNGTGTGFSNGIAVSLGSRVEGNHCYGNTGGAASHGIRVTNANNLILGNSTASHTHGGIIFLLATGNRCESNRGQSETETIETTAPGVAPASVGAGDLANVPI